VGCFGGNGVPKMSQQPGELEEIPCKGSDRDPPGDVCGTSSGRSVSRLALRHRAATLSDIIINENLKLLQLNYLARKVDVFLIFLLGHIVLVTELMARLCSPLVKTQTRFSPKERTNLASELHLFVLPSPNGDMKLFIYLMFYINFHFNTTVAMRW
jgi:hypothetical protein